MVSAAMAWEAQHGDYQPFLGVIPDGLTGGHQPVHNGATDDPMGQGGWDGGLTET